MLTRSMYEKQQAELLNHTQLNKRAKERRDAKKKKTQNNLNRALAQLLRSTEALKHEQKQYNATAAAAARRANPKPLLTNKEKALLVARVRKNAAAAERLKAQRWRAKRAKVIR